MSSELLVDLVEDPATAQLGQLKLATIEDQQWPADESTLSKSGMNSAHVHVCGPFKIKKTRWRSMKRCCLSGNFELEMLLSLIIYILVCFRDGHLPAL